MDFDGLQKYRILAQQKEDKRRKLAAMILKENDLATSVTIDNQIYTRQMFLVPTP